MAEPAIATYIRSVEGRLVPRWGTSQFFGARVTSDAERAKGAERIVWDTERVYAITVAFETAHPRELRQAMKNGDLKPSTKEEFDAWQVKRAKAEEAAAKAAKKAAEEAAKKAKSESEAAAAQAQDSTASERKEQ